MNRGRSASVRILALVGLVALSFLVVFVLSDALDGASSEPREPPGSEEARLGADHPGEAVHLVGAAAAIGVGAVGLGGLLIKPDRVGSATHAGVTVIAWTVVAVIVGNPDNHGGQAGPLDFAFLILALPALVAVIVAAPWRARPGGWRARLPLIAMTMLGAPWAWYAVGQALVQRNTWPPLADPHHQAHWFVMGYLSAALLLLPAGAALGGSGWRPAAVTAGAAALALAAASLTAPSAASALGPWALPAAGWGLCLVLAAFRSPDKGGNGMTRHLEER